jgi:outer membrane protein TolC
MYLNAPQHQIIVFFLAFMGATLCRAQELLPLDRALDLALNGNRELAQSALDQNKSDDAIASARTRRLPQFKLYAIGGQLLTRPSIEFSQGVFGTYRDIGPIPNQDTRVEAPRRPTVLVVAQAGLPLSQQYRIRLQLRQLGLEKILRGERTKEARQKLAQEVRQTYYSILQLQAEAESTGRSVSALEQAEKTAREHAEQKTVLRTELLEIQAQLQKVRSEAHRAASRIATQKETLNLLLGRSIELEFRVAPPAQPELTEKDIAALRLRAVEERPDIRNAEIRLQMAELDSKIKRSEYIPDVSLSVNYLSAFNISNVLPANVATAGITVEWEGFDWGRKKHELAEKAKATQQARLQLEQIREKIRLEVGASVRQLGEVRHMLAASRAAQESARESLRVAQTKFEEKAALLKDVLSAQAAAAAADYEHQRAMLAYLSAEAELKRVLGEAL